MGRGPLGKVAAFVGFLWGISLALFPVFHIVENGFEWVPPSAVTTASWVLGLGGAFALLRYRPSIRVDTTWFFAIVTVLVAVLLEQLYLLAGGRLDEAHYPVLALTGMWIAALAVAHVLTFRGGWVALKRRLSPWP